MSSAESMSAAYRALAHKAWDANRTRAAELTALVTEWRRTGGVTAEQRQQGRSVAHNLRGSAGTFGHDLASSAAERLEQILASVPEEAPLDVVEDLVERIHGALAREPEAEF